MSDRKKWQNDLDAFEIGILGKKRRKRRHIAERKF